MMKRTAYLVGALTLTLTASAMRTAMPSRINHGENMREAMQRLAPRTNLFDSEKSRKADAMNSRMDARLGTSSPLRIATPQQTIGPVRSLYDIDGPDGQIWYCTTDLGCTYIQHELYDEAILQEYTFTIYDADLQEVGRVHDIMRYDEEEVRVPGPDNGIGLLPIVTKNYFNSDDNYEIVVSLAVNTTTPGLNHYRSLVYSIGGEKETVTVKRDNSDVQIEVDKPVSRINSFVAHVLNLSTPGNEKIYMTFEAPCGEYIDIDFEKLMEGDEEEGQKYWQSMSTNGIRYSMYAKADADGNLVKVFERDQTYQTAQGDQESSPTLLTFTDGDDAYLVFPYYKETFFNPFYSPLEDMSMREGNSLVIELYKLTETGLELRSKTEVPMVKGDGDSVLATYYSVGDLTYSKDASIDSEGQARYIVTRCNYTTDNDETSGYSYYIYSENGNLVNTIFSEAESSLVLSDLDGQPTQGMFVIYDDDEGYVYNFVDIFNPEPSKKVKINYLLEQNDDFNILSFNADRVLHKDMMQYGFELRKPYYDNLDQTYLGVAWFNCDGSFDRIDFVNMGTNVNYATVLMDARVLDASFICSDSEHEYMVLIKRSLTPDGTEAREEFLVSQPLAPYSSATPKVLLHALPCEKGVLSLLGYYPGATSDSWRLMIGYEGEEGYSADFYALPFDSSSIKDVANLPEDAAIEYSNGTLKANGEIIVYNTTGTRVAKSHDILDTTTLPAGIYIAVAGNSAIKFSVK